MSHPFGDLIWQHLIRKKGLSQNKLAMGINQDPAVIARMCNGKALTGPQSRERIVQIIEWLYAQGVLDYLEEANALLATADKPGLMPEWPRETELLRSLKAHSAMAGAITRDGRSGGTDAAQQEAPDYQQRVPPSPYRGLFAFREEDAAFYCGRETFNGKLIDAVYVQHKPLVAVIGPSGSGQSPLAFSGVVPQSREAGGWSES